LAAYSISGTIYKADKAFPTEREAKQFAKAKLSQGLKVTAGTLNPHLPIRRLVLASEIEKWIEEKE
jgi:hypothetical protein